MRIRILESLERKARAARKQLPAWSGLESKRLAIEKRLAAGKISRRMAADLKGLLRLRRKRLLHREIYRLLTAAA